MQSRSPQMKQRFLNQKLGKRNSRWAEMKKAKRMLNKPHQLLQPLRVIRSSKKLSPFICTYFFGFLSKIYGLILVREVSLACDKGPFPWHRRFGIRTIVWSPLEFCC